MVPINFKANFIRPVEIQRQSKPYQASFVELNPYDANDLNTLAKLDIDWQPSYAHSIYSFARENSKISNPANDGDKYYAITTQNNSFEKLEPSKVLGLAKCKEKSSKYIINFLQTNPNYAYQKSMEPKTYINPFSNFWKDLFNPTEKIKGIGKGMIDCIKQEADEKSVELWSVNNAKEFYIKQGFEEQNNNMFMWTPDNK